MRTHFRMLLLASLVSACGTGGSTGPPSIVLISIDTLRADHLSSYGYRRPTPHIDALSREGVRFDEAHATAPWTLPSHMSMLTGRFSSEHGVEEETQTLDAGVGLLTEALSRAGYRTAGFAANQYLNGEYGFSRGFDHYEVVPYRDLEIPRAEVVVRRALRWLRKTESEQPFFLFVHLMDPHYPYRAPAPFGGRYSSGYQGRFDGTTNTIAVNLRGSMAPGDLGHLIDLYDEEIAYVDSQVGRLVERIRKRPGGERVVVLLTSDHGEEFKEHGSLGHALTLYREQSHVPLILSDPESPHRGEQVSAAVRLIDIAPTLAEIAGLDPSDPFVAALEGVPLMRHLGDDPPGPLPVITETSRWGPKRAALSLGGRKAISPMTYRWWLGSETGGRWTQPWVRGLELYDIDSDPAEARRRSVAPEDEALSQLSAWRERTWRGVQLRLQLPKGFDGELRLPASLAWEDQPSLDDGQRLYPVEVEAGRIQLAGLPERPLTLLLPIEATSAGTLELHSTRGELSLYDGETWHRAAPDNPARVDLTSLPPDAAPSSSPPKGPQASLRIRPLARVGGLEIDEPTRDQLEALGYGRAEP